MDNASILPLILHVLGQITLAASAYVLASSTKGESGLSDDEFIFRWLLAVILLFMIILG